MHFASGLLIESSNETVRCPEGKSFEETNLPTRATSSFPEAGMEERPACRPLFSLAVLVEAAADLCPWRSGNSTSRAHTVRRIAPALVACSAVAIILAGYCDGPVCF